MKVTISPVGEIDSIADAHIEIDHLVRVAHTINKTARQLILDAPKGSQLTDDVLCLLSAQSDELEVLAQIVEIVGQLAFKS